jgi:mono/diheme cytochrome c family protein
VNALRPIATAVLAVAGMALLFSGLARAQQQDQSAARPAATASPSNDADLRIEGEKRFQANCGRCHQSPHKFPPRMVMTIERHMRVRATLTDQDMRLIVRYLLQ